MRKSIQHCRDRGLPFAAYRIPGKGQRLLVQEKGPVHSFGPEDPFPLSMGYLVIPFAFSNSEPAYMLAPDLLLTKDDPERLPKGRFADGLPDKPPVEHFDDRSTYLEKVGHVLELIKGGKGLEKLVLSRSEWAEGKLDIGLLFESLMELYPDAYVHLLHIPEQSTWIGASPETLLEVGQKGRTQALAGTRAWGEEEWTDKERKEQESVADHIRSVLRVHGVPIEKEEGPRAIPAGGIEHLCTDFFFDPEALKRMSTALLRDLHPTPAVCGVPKDRAMELIHRLEPRSRELYAGALGPWGVDEERALYVNLRCARIWGKGAELFVGGGINEGSEPDKEWEETERKARTMLRVFS